MRFTLSVKSALIALGFINGVTVATSSIAILAFTQIVAEAGCVKFTACDLGRRAQAFASAKVEAAGAVCAPSRALLDMLRSLPKDGEVAGMMEGGLLKLICGRARFSLPTLPVEDFPDLGTGEGGVELAIAAPDLARALSCVAPAMSSDETRYYLQGAFAHYHGGALRLVATDGHKLIRCDTGAVAPSNMAAVIIPSSTVKEMLRLAEGAGKSELRLTISPTGVELVSPEGRITSKLIDGTFPDYGRIVPSSWTTRAEIETAPFERAIARALTVASDRGRAGRLTLDSDSLIVSSSHHDGAAARDEIETHGFEGPPIEIGFNLDYLAAMLRAFGVDSLALELTDHGAPAVLRPLGDSRALGVLMPLRV